MKYKTNSLISANQIKSRVELENYFRVADHLRAKKSKPLQDRVVACLFYEPSTRTRFSFETACIRLGGQVLSSENAKISSSASKGETIEDTVRVISNYADAIVIRHPENRTCERAALASAIPVINAGDGSNEHPSQAILDLYTIQRRFGKVHGLKIALVGDLLYGRTVHSLSHLFSLYKNVELFLVSPKKLKMPTEFLNVLKKNKVKFTEQEDLKSILPEIDVLYMTRVQKERFESEKEYYKYANSYCIDKNILKLMKKESIIMHPLPRITEITPDVDDDKRAYYFEQVQNGLYIRMAILERAINKK